MFCGNCGKGINFGKRFCASCGAPVGKGNKFHMACGAAITLGKPFCRGCGKPIGQIEPYKPPEPEKEPKNRNGQGNGGTRRTRAKGKKYTSTVKEKGGVTIPKQVQEVLGIEAGDSIVFVVQEDGTVFIEAPSKKQR